MNLAELAEQRAKEFISVIKRDLLQALPASASSRSLGIYTCLKQLAAKLAIGELQILLYVAEHPHISKRQLATAFEGTLGYSTVYRKLNRMLAEDILVEGHGLVDLGLQFEALAILAQIHTNLKQGES